MGADARAKYGLRRAKSKAPRRDALAAQPRESDVSLAEAGKDENEPHYVAAAHSASATARDAVPAAASLTAAAVEQEQKQNKITSVASATV